MTHFAKQTFQKLLKEAGYSLTKPREFLFDFLLSHQKPHSMNELTKEVGKGIDRASVYRAVQLFESLGIVKRIAIGWKYKIELSEQFSSHHHHIHCISCGKTIDIKEPPQLEQYIQEMAKKYHFKVLAHSFEVEGMCADCLRLQQEEKERRK